MDFSLIAKIAAVALRWKSQEVEVLAPYSSYIRSPYTRARTILYLMTFPSTHRRGVTFYWPPPAGRTYEHDDA